MKHWINTHQRIADMIGGNAFCLAKAKLVRSNNNQQTEKMLQTRVQMRNKNHWLDGWTATNYAFKVDFCVFVFCCCARIPYVFWGLSYCELGDHALRDLGEDY